MKLMLKYSRSNEEYHYFLNELQQLITPFFIKLSSICQRVEFTKASLIIRQVRNLIKSESF